MTSAGPLLYNTNVYLHAYNKETKQFEPKGDGNAVGCVLLGADTNFQLMFYTATKETICATGIAPEFKITPQPNNYVNFFDQEMNNWSMRFKDTADSSTFIKNVMLIRIHLYAHAGASVAPEKVLKQTLKLGKPEHNGIMEGDTAGVAFSAWKLESTVDANPLELLTTTAPFDHDDLRKVKTGERSSSLAGLQEGIVGMKKGEVCLMFVPPAVSGTYDSYVIQVEVQKVKTANKSKPPVSTPAIKEGSVEQQPPQAESTLKRQPSHEELVSRMAHLSRVGSGKSIIPDMAALNSLKNTFDSPQKLIHSQSQRKSIDSSMEAIDLNGSTPAPSVASATASAISATLLSSVPSADISSLPAHDTEPTKAVHPTPSTQTPQLSISTERRPSMAGTEPASTSTQLSIHLQEEQLKLKKRQAYLEEQRRQLDEAKRKRQEQSPYSSLQSTSGASSYMGRGIALDRPPTTTSTTYTPPIPSRISRPYSTDSNSIPMHLTKFQQPSSTSASSVSAYTQKYESEVLRILQTRTQHMEAKINSIDGKVDQVLFETSSMSRRTSASPAFTSPVGKSSSYFSEGMHPSSLVKGVERLVDENKRLTQEVDDRSRHVDELSTQIEELMGKNHQLMLESQRLSERSSKTQQYQSNAENQLRKLEQSNDELQLKVDELKKEKQELIHDLLQHQNQMKETQSSFEEMEELKQMLAHEIQTRELVESQNKHQSEVNAHEQQVNESMKQENEQLATSLHSAEAKITEYHTIQQDLQQKLHQQQQEIDTFQAQANESLEQTREAMESQIAQLRETHEQEMLVQMQKCEELELNGSKAEEVNSQVEELSHTVARLQGELQAQARDMQDKEVEYQSEAGQKQAQIEDLQSRINSLEGAAAEQSQEIEKLRSNGDTEPARSLSLEKMSDLIKEVMNDVYFEFQDEFQLDKQTEDDSAAEEPKLFHAKEIVSGIRKILKANTIAAMDKLEASSTE